MPILKQDKQDLDQIYSDWSDRYGGRKEDYFACLYLKSKFRRDVQEIAHQVAFGGNDYGLDAFYIDREAKNLYLYQFKWSENHNLFKESLERLAQAGMQRIFGNAMADPLANELLSTLRAELQECKSLIKHVLIHFVFKGEVEDTDGSEGLRTRRENLENKIHLIHEFFGDQEVGLTVEFIADRRLPPKPKPAESHSISFVNPVRVETQDQTKTMYVGFVPLMDLYRIYKSLGQRFLDRNIRYGLSAENAPNKKIREALGDIVLKQKVAPDVFAFNHNGVTLAAEHLTTHENHTALRVPRLLNGAQTITSLAKFLVDNEGHPALSGTAPALESIRVLAKIVVDDPFSDFVTTVTICNNRQNPVEPWNLRANDRIQCDLHDKLREEARIFYSRQDNAFRNHSVEDLEEMGFEAGRDMGIRPLAQTFLAVQGEIAKMSQLPEVFENQKWYEETFRESYLQCDVRRIVIAYKVGLVLKDPMTRLDERSNQKHKRAISRGRNLVWALLIQGILNDPSISELLEEYGTSLRKEVNFRENLKSLASGKLLPVLKEVLSSDEYRERLETERYEFIRTKEMFNQCKSVAAEKFGWTKKTL